MLPLLEPMEPVEVAIPIKVNVPEVEVTVPPDRTSIVPEKVTAPVVD